MLVSSVQVFTFTIRVIALRRKRYRVATQTLSVPLRTLTTASGQTGNGGLLHKNADIRNDAPQAGVFFGKTHRKGDLASNRENGVPLCWIRGYRQSLSGAWFLKGSEDKERSKYRRTAQGRNVANSILSKSVLAINATAITRVQSTKAPPSRSSLFALTIP